MDDCNFLCTESLPEECTNQDIVTRLDQIISLLTNQQSAPMTEDQYKQYLLQMQKLQIIKERYYPDFNTDWSFNGGGISNVLSKSGVTIPAFIDIFNQAIKGWYSFGILNTDAANSLAVSCTATDAFGNVATTNPFALFVVGPGAILSKEAIDTNNWNFTATLNRPITNIQIQVEDAAFGFPATFDARFVGSS